MDAGKADAQLKLVPVRNIHWHVQSYVHVMHYADLDNCSNPNNKHVHNDMFDSTDDETELDGDIELQV